MKKFDFRLPMNLQFFADPDGNGDGGDPTGAVQQGQQQQAGGTSIEGDDGNATNSNSQQAGGKTYTDDEVDAIVKAKRAKWKAEQDAAVSQAKKLAGLSEEEAAKAEAEAAKQEAEAAKNQLEAYKMRDTARSMFTKAEVPITDADLDLVVTADADSTKAKVKQLINFAQRASKGAESKFLSGNHLKKPGDKPEPAGARGAAVAKAEIGSNSRPNPYFGNQATK